MKHTPPLSPFPSCPPAPAAAFFLMFACCLLLTACGAPPQLPLRIGVNPWVGYDPLVLARERRLLDPGELRVVELESSRESARQLRNGLLDAAGLTLAETVELAAAGIDLKVIAVLSLSRGADAVIAREVSSSAALKGARLGMEDGALAHVMLRRLLEAGGLRRDDVQVFTMPVVEHEQAMRRQQVDAVITFEPVISRLLAAGYHVVLDSANMPGEVVDVLVIRTDALAARPQQARALLHAFEQGRRALLAQPADAARTLAAGADLDADEYVRALGNLRLFSVEESAALLAAVPDVPVLGLDQLADDLRASQRVMMPPDWKALFEPAVAAGLLAAEPAR